MDTLDFSAFQSHGQSGSTSAVPVTDASSWVAVALLKLGGHQRNGLMTLTVGAGGALGDLKFSRASLPGGAHIDWLVSTGFNTPAGGDAVAVIPATGLNTLAAGAAGQVKFHGTGGVQELKVWAKMGSTPTTLTVDASFVA